MKKLLLLIMPLIISCTMVRRDKQKCTENKKFKKEFFKRINLIEDNLSLRQDSSFKNSLIFISNYAPVSFYETMNYARIYPPQALVRDKEIWLKWYEKNKCTNIQLKKDYPVPEQYKEFFEYDDL